MPIASAKITSKGQVTLPAELRRELGLKPGDRLDFERNSAGGIELAARTKTLADVKGILPYDGPSLSNEDIVKLVADARRQRADQIVKNLKVRQR